MGSVALAHVLRPLQEIFRAADYPDLLVGLSDPDDAAVLRRSDDEAIVVTADFFPPVVDNPEDYGAIAAANAMSDVFAMGGEVLLALNLVAFPDSLPPEVQGLILRGGAEAVRAAGGVIAGGHSVVDREPKYGLAVIGRVHPERLLRKSGARPGDVLVLTKALGTGLISTALKGRRADPEHVAVATASMMALNRAAGRLAVSGGARAATDITGFGLIGHALEMADQGGVEFRLDWAALPILPGALDYAAAGCIAGGLVRNREAFAPRVTGLAALPPPWADVLFDPQTSGGLLVALPAASVATFRAALAAEGGAGSIIGAVTAGSGVAVA